METELYTTQYDAILQSKLPHLQNYPEMLPHIGSKYNEAPKKILLIGESHYIPIELLTQNHIRKDNWYNCNSKEFNKERKGWISTRCVINRVEYEKGFTIFANVKRALQTNLRFYDKAMPVFTSLAYYNYFQRPHFVEGGSIENNKTDDNIAYDTLKVVSATISPDSIIFLSGKAYKSFRKIVKIHAEQPMFNSKYKIGNVPHPTCSWWNIKSKPYTVNGIPVTGREKFIHLITS